MATGKKKKKRRPLPDSTSKIPSSGKSALSAKPGVEFRVTVLCAPGESARGVATGPEEEAPTAPLCACDCGLGGDTGREEESASAMGAFWSVEDSCPLLNVSVSSSAAVCVCDCTREDVGVGPVGDEPSSMMGW